MATVIRTTFKLKRGLEEQWLALNPILQDGEPGFVIDKNLLKVGDGKTAWKDLRYINEDVCSVKVSTDGVTLTYDGDVLTLAGFNDAEAGQSIRKTADGKLEWYTPATETRVVEIETKVNEVEKHVETLTEKTETISQGLELVDASAEKVKYAILNKPEGTLVDYREKEIRVMCPVGTVFTQQSGAGDPNMHYMGFYAYAPEGAVSFKEDDAEIISDNTMYYFENNPYAGIDDLGRKYSVSWLALARKENGEWSYFGKNSSKEKYVGWYYTVEWYDANGVIIESDQIRINLANESCFLGAEDYYMNQYQKKTDPIAIDRLVGSENTIIIFDGGSAENAII